MPRIDHDQDIGPEGITRDIIVTRPERVVSPEQMQQAKQTLRTYWQTFTVDGAPTGTPTAVQQRNATLALIAAVRFLAGEMDDET